MNVTEFLGEFRLRFPDVTLEIGLKYVNRALRALSFRVPLRRVADPVDLTSGVPEYDLDPTVSRVEEVYYETSSSGKVVLSETSIDELNLLSPGWRAAAAAAPTKWYRSSSSTGDSSKTVIGLYPTPSVTTSEDYPRIRVYGAGTVELDLNDNIPTNLLSNDVLLDVMSYYFAKDRKRDEVVLWKPLHDLALGENVQFVKEGSSEGSTVLMPAYAPGARGV